MPFVSNTIFDIDEPQHTNDKPNQLIDLKLAPHHHKFPIAKTYGELITKSI